ncbi:head GIN domain-containing protein [Winogradskyella jejuensis]|uniref:Putative auto-transporter adhesin, head GIN domain n=1 Tax=Winogradskyella jejuensis TaxID=1089305 RepID=A0A1M5JPD7_9FLAO|nr:head GIN domain-containing protein [Winogradskyella jejuensis]SHG42150.1 Putative auto-transporter adhesin, head GIN domain [Winogradskyella jejuensis]
MSTLARIIAASIVALFMTSCNFDINLGPGVSGDGNVVTKERNISSDFDKIKVSRGIEVYITQGNSTSLEVEADENLHDVITTEVDEDNGLLRISSNENIKSSSSKKVILSVKDISSISTTSGSYVNSENAFDVDKLTISSTSGSHVDFDITSNSLKINSTSGAGVKISGQTRELNVSATSGSYIKAGDLKAENTRVSATSGANISVNTSKELTANATSGGSIKYSGNPEKVTKSDGVSGSIRAN